MSENTIIPFEIARLNKEFSDGLEYIRKQHLLSFGEQMKVFASSATKRNLEILMTSFFETTADVLTRQSLTDTQKVSLLESIVTDIQAAEEQMQCQLERTMLVADQIVGQPNSKGDELNEHE